jgi:hypothetical protein
MGKGMRLVARSVWWDHRGLLPEFVEDDAGFAAIVRKAYGVTGFGLSAMGLAPLASMERTDLG